MQTQVTLAQSPRAVAPPSDLRYGAIVMVSGELA